MQHRAHDPRLVPIPAEQVEIVAELVERRGIPAAMEETGLGRTALLGVLGRRKALPGSAALLREALRRRGTVA